MRAQPAGRDADRAVPVAAQVIPVSAATPQPHTATEHGAALQLPHRDAVEAQPDLYRYAQQLQQQVRAGDAQAGWRLSRVYDYCAPYAASPSGYAADSAWIAAQHTPGVAAMHAARQRLAQRCAGFAPIDGLSPRMVAQQRLVAARAGSLAAEAALLALGEPLHASPGYKRALVQRVLASRDPEAYLALAPAMGARASGDDSRKAMWPAISSPSWLGRWLHAGWGSIAVPAAPWSPVIAPTRASARATAHRISCRSYSMPRCRGREQTGWMRWSIHWSPIRERSHELPSVGARRQVLVMGGIVRGVFGGGSQHRDD
ncbi:hypothetical protein XFF6992_20060 [Xanthomonas citri pv. fuscans]|nr:hypothetical protein XFF6992_20060 [Xanthomonas citri pv. fuscans]